MKRKQDKTLTAIFSHNFVSDHIVIDDCYYLLSLYKTCYYFDDIIKFEDFDIYNTLIDEKSHENILIYVFQNKTLIGPKHLHIRFDKNTWIYLNLWWN